MIQLLNTYTPKIRAFIIVSLLLISSSFAQNVTGPTPVSTGSTHTYSYSNNGMLILRPSWSITGGTQISAWYSKNPYVLYVSVQWGTGSSGQVRLLSNNNPLSTLNVSLTGGSSAPVCADTSLSNENYVHTLAPRTATTNTSTLDNAEKIESVTYFDGLGRTKQSIAIRAGADCEDIITHLEYDQYGRAKKEYLPFAQGTNGGAIHSNALSATTAFYNTTKYENTSNPFSEKEFEASPLNRVFKQAAPGYDWRMGGGHEIELDYQTNSSSEVRRYKANTALQTSGSTKTYNPTLVSNIGFYNSGELYKTITKDENHTGSTKNHTTEEFKDAEGRVILKRTYNENIAHDTYYVYDDYGNLTYVLPPKVVHDTSISSTELSELCYQYKYDHRNRLVEKKIPGKGWEYIIYNRLDQPIMTQDANLQAQGKWLFTKYDVFGRVAYTGLTPDSRLRTAVQNTANGISSQYVERTDSELGYGGTLMHYNNGGYPTYIPEILTINYYDNYDFNKDGGNSESAYSVTPITNVKGLATGSKVRVLGTSEWITSVTYYDAKARPIYIYSKNDYLNTTDKIKSNLEFDGRVTETTTTHARTGFATITTVDSFTYDHTNRLIDQKQTINGSTPEVIVENNYDELGQLISKGVGGKTTQARLQDVDYTYNIRGWLKGINNPNSLGNDLFAFGINYNTIDHHTNNANKLFNGNISETKWRTANTDNSLKWYKYSYDALNRIESGIASNNNYSLINVDYDKNGNITNLNRRGHTNLAATAFGTMDNLDYNYYAKSNRLQNVQELSGGNNTYGFKNGSTAATEYTYDANGNMLRDLNKGISSNILYNHLNLPTRVTLGGGNIQYIYDATGVKQKKIVSNGATTYYAGNYIYENNTLKFFSQPEGYVEPNGQGFSYVYQYKDHLGNIRLAYSDSNNNGSINSTEIIEENNYYPFGLKHKGYNSNVNGVDHKWGYLNQEENDELGLGWLTFRYRNYMPELGRFFGVDPISEDFLSISNYQFAHNSPIWKIELEGLEGAISPDIPGTIDIPNREPMRGHSDKGSSAIPIGDGTGNHGSASRKVRALPTDVKVDVKESMNTIFATGAALAVADGNLPFGDGAGAAYVVSGVAAVGIGVALSEVWNWGANIYNSVNDAETAGEAANEKSESKNKSGESTKENGKVRTENELEAALNQAEGIEKAQESAKKEVKGQKQNKIRSVRKSQQRLKNALKDIDINNIKDID